MESAGIRSIAFLQVNLRVFLSLGIWWSGIGKRSVLIHTVCFAQFVCALLFSFHCLLLSFFFVRCGSMYVGNISRIIFVFCSTCSDGISRVIVSLVERGSRLILFQMGLWMPFAGKHLARSMGRRIWRNFRALTSSCLRRWPFLSSKSHLHDSVFNSCFEFLILFPFACDLSVSYVFEYYCLFLAQSQEHFLSNEWNLGCFQ